MCASHPSNLINAKMFFRNCFKQCSYFITFSSAFICFKIGLLGRPRIQRQLEVELELERVIYVISTKYVVIAEKLDIIYCPPPLEFILTFFYYFQDDFKVLDQKFQIFTGVIFRKSFENQKLCFFLLELNAMHYRSLFN